jgi:hypothetical protein
MQPQPRQERSLSTFNFRLRYYCKVVQLVVRDFSSVWLILSGMMPTSALILAEISNEESSPLHSERLHQLRLQMCPGVLLPSYLRLEDFIG